MERIEVGKRSGSRMTAEARRRQIVTIAIELFSRKGFNGTTTKEIADRAGVSEAIIFRHFPTKQALYSAIIDFKLHQYGDRMADDLQEASQRKDDVAFFTAVARDFMDAHLKDPAVMRLLMYSALEGHELSHMFFKATASGVRHQIRRYIKQRVADGAFRNVDPAVASRAFCGMIFNHIQIRVMFNNALIDDLKMSDGRVADHFVEIFLRGIRNDRPVRHSKR